MRLPRNVYRPLVVPTEETLPDLLVRFGNAFSPQLYPSATSPIRGTPSRKEVRLADIQQSITRHHHAQLGGVFVLALLNFLEPASGGVPSHPACTASGLTSVRPPSV